MATPLENQDESIVNQQTTSEEGQQAQQTQESSEPGQSVQAEESIPEKFVGKSPAEIIGMYRELEKDRGRMANELGSTRKEREALEARASELEKAHLQMQANPTQVPPQIRSVEVEEEVDPLSVFEEQFDSDPKKAIAEALRLQQKQLEKRQSLQTAQQRAEEANKYYYEQKKSNPDYARREPMMRQLASEVQDIFKSDQFNSAKTMRLLDLASKGLDMDHYLKQAGERAQKDSLSVREEKRRAQSETSTGGSEASKAIAEMSMDEMKKYFGYADK